MHGGGGKYFICVMYANETLLESTMKSTICNYWSLKYDSIKKTMCVLSSEYLLIYTAQNRLKGRGSCWVKFKIFRAILTKFFLKEQ